MVICFRWPEFYSECMHAHSKTVNPTIKAAFCSFYVVTRKHTNCNPNSNNRNTDNYKRGITMRITLTAFLYQKPSVFTQCLFFELVQATWIYSSSFCGWHNSSQADQLVVCPELVTNVRMVCLSSASSCMVCISKPGHVCAFHNTMTKSIKKYKK